MGYMTFYRELWRLLRNAPHSHLIAKYPPWKRGVMQRYFFVLQALFIPIWTLLCICYVLLDDSGSSWFPPHFTVFIYSMFFVVGAGSSLSMPINLLVYHHPATANREQLEELYLTRVPHREIAFASIFWGVVGGALVPLGGVLAVASRSFFDADEIFFLPCISMLAITGNSIIAVFWRLRLVNRPWLLLILGPLTTAATAYWVAGFAGLFTDWMDDRASELWSKFTFGFFSLIAVLLLAPIAGTRSTTIMEIPEYFNPSSESSTDISPAVMQT